MAVIPITDRSPEERAEMGRKGGIASGISKRKAKSMREAARILLEAPLLDDETTAAALEALGLAPDQQGSVLLAALRRAQSGDIEAARYVRDTSGQAPAQAVELATHEGSALGDLSGLTTAQLEELLEAAKASADGGEAD